MQAQYDVFSNDLPMPELPPKRSYQPPTPGPAPPSGAPNPPEAVLASQPPAQRQRLEADLQQAREMEAQQAKVCRAACICRACIDHPGQGLRGPLTDIHSQVCLEANKIEQVILGSDPAFARPSMHIGRGCLRSEQLWR